MFRRRKRPKKAPLTYQKLPKGKKLEKWLILYLFFFYLETRKYPILVYFRRTHKFFILLVISHHQNNFIPKHFCHIQSIGFSYTYIYRTFLFSLKILSNHKFYVRLLPCFTQFTSFDVWSTPRLLYISCMSL